MTRDEAVKIPRPCDDADLERRLIVEVKTARTSNAKYVGDILGDASVRNIVLQITEGSTILEDLIAKHVAALTAPAAGEDVARSWRCFHCDEVFASADAAREHFGSSELDEPGCKMLAKGELELLRDYRDMAARWQRCVSEDCDASRIYHSMSAKIATAEREAEQKGYDRGLEDGRLRAVPQGVPDDVRRLVIAAREVAFGDAPPDQNAIKELDAASEAFASRIPWDDEPEPAAPAPGKGE